MTCIEITGENAREVVGILEGMLDIANPRRFERMCKENEPVHEVRKEIHLHDIRPDPVQTETGLGKISEEVQKETSPLDKLTKDLRAGWEWLSDDMPISPDIRPNMIKAVKVLEIISGALQMNECIRISALAAIGEALK